MGEEAEGIGEFVWGVEGVGVAVEGLRVADGRRSRQRIDARETPVRRVVVPSLCKLQTALFVLLVTRVILAHGGTLISDCSHR